MNFYGTLGMACAEEETLYQMFRAGMTGARLNLSHTNLKESGGLLNCFRAAAERAAVEANLVLDLRGPELRVGQTGRTGCADGGHRRGAGSGRHPHSGGCNTVRKEGKENLFG